MKDSRILLVDDEANTLYVLKSILEDEFQVATAQDGEEGLALYREQPFDLVVSDQRMPDLSGVEMLTRMRSISDDSIRIILSAYADFNAVVRAVNEGHIYRFVLKPWNPEEMLDTIRQALLHLKVTRQASALVVSLQERNSDLEAVANELRLTQQSLVRKEKLAAVGKLAGTMLHEVNNHLMIFEFAEAFQDKYKDIDEIYTFLESASQVREAVFGMLDGYRNYLKGEPQHYDWQSHNLRLILEKAVERIRMSAFTQGHEIVLEDGPDLMFKTDVAKLMQVVVNLAKNGCHAMSKPGTLRVSFGTNSSDANVYVEVSDCGCGVPEELADQIWVPFYSDSNESGLGLGLDICKTFVEGLGGTIIHKNNDTGGATFRIELEV
jgi:C4-dicarboxylate-specific signal transduction histidine kinase